jgi:3-hydroxy-3-methylglutaryl CoA synthase
MVTIGGYGAYVPRYRIERSTIADQHGAPGDSGELAVPAHDESVLTLAVQAAKTALDHADVAADSGGGSRTDGIDAVYTATTSDPFDERGLAAHVSRAVGAGTETRVGDFQGSARAATNALLGARDAIEAGRVGRVLVAASDVLGAPPGSAAERSVGAGAGALVLEAGGGADVATLDGVGLSTTGFVGRFEPADGGPRTGDRRFNRGRYVESASEAIEGIGGDLAPQRAVVPTPENGWGSRALGALDCEAEVESTFDAVGYAGAASALLDLALAFEKCEPGETIVLTGYGPGGADAIAMTAGESVEEDPEMTVQEYIDSKEYVTYANHRSYRERAGAGGVAP